MWKRFVEACHAIEPGQSMTGTGCGRWLGVRTSAVIAFLVFWTYLCPVIMVYWPLFKFKEHYWLVGLILTWSNRLADYVSNITGRIPELLTIAEGGERLLELEKDCPVSLLPYQSAESLRNLRDDTDQDIIGMIFDVQESENQTTGIDRSTPVIDFKNLKYQIRSGVYFSVGDLKVMSG